MDRYLEARRAAALAHSAQHIKTENPSHVFRTTLDVTVPEDRADLISLFGAVRTWTAYLSLLEARIAYTASYNRWALDPRHALQKEKQYVLTQLRLAEQEEGKEQTDADA